MEPQNHLNHWIPYQTRTNDRKFLKFVILISWMLKTRWGGITRNRLLSSSQLRVRSSGWIMKSSVFIFKILSVILSSFFTRANRQTSQKPGFPYPPPPLQIPIQFNFCPTSDYFLYKMHVFNLTNVSCRQPIFHFISAIEATWQRYAAMTAIKIG